MALDIRPGEQYVIRRKVLKILGAAFHIYNPRGEVVGYCKQKALKLREDIRVYTDESCTQEFFRIAAKQIIDFSATYIVTLPDGSPIGSLRRKGMKSSFVRDEWLVFDGAGRQVALLHEESTSKAVMRRYLEFAALLFPQKFSLVTMQGRTIASFRQHFNLFVYRLSVSVLEDNPEIDDLMILAAGCLISAIEGRQGSWA